jgi:hypothetical protein
MPRQTNQGKAYSIEELLRLGSINSFGPYNGAIMGALTEAKSLRNAVTARDEEITHLKNLLSEAMHDRFIAESKRDSKKDK